MNEHMKLGELIKPLVDARLNGAADTDIRGIEYDSRKIKPGMLFAAVRGFKVDGNRFIPAAVKNGAAAVMTEDDTELDVPVVMVSDLRKAMADVAAHFYGYPGRKLKVVGVTGTNGKSTSVYLIKTILEAAGEKTGMVSSLVYDTGTDRYKAERTTPDSVDLQRLLSEMHDAHCVSGVIEVSSHALVLHRVDNIDFQVGLYTNFSRDHLDFHKTMEEYLRAKKLFLDKLVGKNKMVVINMDVAEFVPFAHDARCRPVTYSAEGRRADIVIKDARLFPDRSEFVLAAPEGERDVKIRLPGRYNLSNAAGSAAAGIAMGIDLDRVAHGLERAQAVPGRFQPIDRGQPFLVLLDYAHTPDAIERLCLSAREITKGKLMILFGCGGDRDRGKRPLMGRAASVHSDYAIITADNPRTEEPLEIIEDIKPGMANNNYRVIPDRREAIAEIVKRAGAGDTVLIAGKGAEDYQETGTERYPFEDRIEVTRTLESLGYREG